MLFLIMPRPAICALKTIRNVTRLREREREYMIAFTGR